jgi:hypothetical protein
MKLDAKVKGGLAWAGLIVILAVPAADILFGKPGASSATATAAVSTSQTAGKPALVLPQAPATDPVQTASTGEGAAVDKFIQSGKKLPSYISDADEVATTPAPVKVQPVTPAATTTAPTEVASIAPTEQTPPVPLPRSARPQWTDVAALPPQQDPPLIVDESGLDPFPLSDEEEIVTGDQLEEWDSGSLAEYLESRGMLSDGSPQPEDEFYVDEPVERRRLDEFFLF